MAQMNREGTNFKSGSLFFPNALDNVGHCIKYTAFKHNGLKLDEGNVDTFLQMPMEFPADGLTLNWNTETDVLAQAGLGNTSIGDLKPAAGAIGKVTDAIRKRGLRGVATKAVGAVTGTDGEDVKKSFERRMGQTANTFQEQFFEGPSFRSFEFSHELIAHNQSETETIREIVKRFRYYASPGMGSSAVTHMHWTYPSYWQIWFLTHPDAPGAALKENDFLPKLGMCVLKEVTADYSGETYGTFSNNAPLNVKLSLSFEETTLVDKKTIETREGVR